MSSIAVQALQFSSRDYSLFLISSLQTISFIFLTSLQLLLAFGRRDPIHLRPPINQAIRLSFRPLYRYSKQPGREGERQTTSSSISIQCAKEPTFERKEQVQKQTITICHERSRTSSWYIFADDDIHYLLPPFFRSCTLTSLSFLL